MTTASRTDHTTSPVSSTGGAGRPRFRLSVLSPVQRPNPVKTIAPTPLDSSAGSMTAKSCGPPTPATSISSTAATSGLPKIAAMAAAAPAAPSSAAALRRRGGAHEVAEEQGQAAAEGDQRGLGAEYGAQRQARQRGDDHARQGGRGGSARAQPGGGYVSAPAGQAQHDEGDHESRHQRQRERPPPRRIVPAEAVRPGHPDQVFQLVQRGEEPERGQRHRDADQAAEHQRPPVPGAPQHRPQLVALVRRFVRGRAGRAVGRLPRRAPGVGRVRVGRRLGMRLRLGDGCSPASARMWVRGSARVPSAGRPAAAPHAPPRPQAPDWRSGRRARHGSRTSVASYRPR